MRNLFLRSAVLSSVVLSALLAGGSNLLAEPRLSTGCLIQSTPFYHRLIQAGVFDPISSMSVETDRTRPVQMLFRMARSFRYASDKAKADQWQSADETSRSYNGDCEDKAIWLYTQMRRSGYRDTSLVIGKYGPRSTEFHTWVTYVDDSGDTILLDPTIQRKPWKIDAFHEKLYRPMHILKNEDCVSL